jgi:AcrR family transcriptional regulator
MPELMSLLDQGVTSRSPGIGISFDPTGVSHDDCSRTSVTLKVLLCKVVLCKVIRIMKTYVRKKRNPAKRRAPEETRELILNAAKELFAAQGYEDTPTAQIAEYAKVSEGAVFHHFKSKREIFFRLAEEYGRECAAATMPDDLAELNVELVVRAAFAFAERNRDLYQFFAMVGPKLDDRDATPMRDAIVSVIQVLLEDDMAQGTVPQGNALLMAELQHAIVERTYSAWCKSGDETDREEYILYAADCMEAISDSI